MNNTPSPDTEKVVADISKQTEIPISVKKPFYKTPIVLGLLFTIVIIATFFAGGKFLGAKEGKVADKIAAVTPMESSPSPTSDPLAAWKTYTNTKSNLKVQYPPAWTTKEIVEGKEVVGVDLQGNEGKVHVLWGTGFGGGCDPENHASIQSFGQTKSICDFKNTDGTEQWRQISQAIDAKTSIEVEATANSPYQKNRNMILQILTTFTFLDSTQSIDTSGWETYTNTKNGYRIKYPPDKLIRLACPEEYEEFNLDEKNAGNASLDSVPVASCARDAHFLMELRTIHVQDASTKPDTEHYDIKSESIKINGFTGTKYTYKQIKPFEGFGGSSWYQIIDIPNSAGAYELYLDNEKYISLRDQILSTFTLIK